MAQGLNRSLIIEVSGANGDDLASPAWVDTAAVLLRAAIGLKDVIPAALRPDLSGVSNEGEFDRLHIRSGLFAAARKTKKYATKQLFRHRS